MKTNYSSYRLAAALGLFLVLVAASTNSFAGDGHRKGLVAGGGLGVAPVARFSRPDTHESGIGFATNLLFGYGVDDRNLIVIEINSAIRHSDLYSDEARGWVDWDGHPLGDQILFQGIGGLAWYHYQWESNKSPFVALGVGLYRFDASPEGHNDGGLGWLLGSGYQFSRRFQLGAYCTFGHTRNYFVGEFSHLQVSLLLTFLNI